MIALEVLGADLDLDEEVVNAEGVKHGATRAVMGVCRRGLLALIKGQCFTKG